MRSSCCIICLFYNEFLQHIFPLEIYSFSGFLSVFILLLDNITTLFILFQTTNINLNIATTFRVSFPLLNHMQISSFLLVLANIQMFLEKIKCYSCMRTMRCIFNTTFCLTWQIMFFALPPPKKIFFFGEGENSNREK